MPFGIADGAAVYVADNSRIHSKNIADRRRDDPRRTGWHLWLNRWRRCRRIFTGPRDVALDRAGNLCLDGSAPSAKSHPRRYRRSQDNRSPASVVPWAGCAFHRPAGIAADAMDNLCHRLDRTHGPKIARMAR